MFSLSWEVVKQKSEAWEVEPMSEGMADFSSPTMSSQPCSIRWCATEEPTIPPWPMITTLARFGSCAILVPLCLQWTPSRCRISARALIQCGSNCSVQVNPIRHRVVQKRQRQPRRIRATGWPNVSVFVGTTGIVERFFVVMQGCFSAGDGTN